MPTTVETTAAMDPLAGPVTPAAATADLPAQTPQQNAPRPGSAAMSPNSILGALAVALVTAMFSVLMWQINSLGDRIDSQSDRIDAQSDRIDAQSLRIDALSLRIEALASELRAEMHAGFREINAILLDHTDRLARLETAVGLPRHVDTPGSPHSDSQ